MKKNIRISTLLNCILVVIFLAYSYSWMVTEPSYGEIVDYNRDLIIASSGVDVDMYIYSGSDYVLYEEENTGNGDKNNFSIYTHTAFASCRKYCYGRKIKRYRCYC